MSSSTDKVIARVGRAHGIRGEVVVKVLVPDSGVFTPGHECTVGERRLTIRSARPHKEALLVSFEEIDDRNDAEQLRGLDLTAPFEELRALDQGEYWPEQLIGLAVWEGQSRVGIVVEIVGGSAQDRLVVEGVDGNRFDIPFVDKLVPEVSLEEGLIRVELIEGIR